MYNRIYSIWIKFIIIIAIILFILFLTGKGCNKINKKIEQSFNQEVEDWAKEQMMQDTDDNNSNNNDDNSIIYDNAPEQLIGLWNNATDNNKYIEINDESIIIIDKSNGKEKIDNIVSYKIKGDTIITDNIIQYKFNISSDNTLTLDFQGVNTIDYINKDIIGTEGEYAFIKIND